MEVKEKAPVTGPVVQHLKFNDFDQTKEALKRLRKLYRETFPTKRAPTYEDKSETGLTRCIIDYLNMKGYQAERIHCIGAPIPQGNGLFKFGKTTMDRGTADISATIHGRSVKIEIKIGTDRMSSYQWNYKDAIERAGGLYLVARSFPHFLKEIHRRITV